MNIPARSDIDKDPLEILFAEVRAIRVDVAAVRAALAPLMPATRPHLHLVADQAGGE